MRCHILTNRIAPYYLGGLESSILRIANALSVDHEVFIYITERIDPSINTQTSDKIHYIRLFESIQELLEPIENEYKRDMLYFRTVYHVMLNTLFDLSVTRENDILFSFYISSFGFIQQRLADTLTLKHVAFVRGSDYSMDMHVPSKMTSIQYVCNNCSIIVATNTDQINNLMSVFKIKKEKFRLCYNSLEYVDFNLSQKNDKSNKTLFVSDVGYSWKKGTHILFKAFEKLYETVGDRCKLYICGSICDAERGYWDHEMRRLTTKYPENIIVDNYNEHFLESCTNSSIYVFPSLAEGCSNALLKALAQEMAIISTKTGFLLDFHKELDGVCVINPANVDELYQAMYNCVNVSSKGNYKERVNFIKQMFSATRERETLKEIVNSI